MWPVRCGPLTAPEAPFLASWRRYVICVLPMDAAGGLKLCPSDGSKTAADAVRSWHGAARLFNTERARPADARPAEGNVCRMREERGTEKGREGEMVY